MKSHHPCIQIKNCKRNNKIGIGSISSISLLLTALGSTFLVWILQETKYYQNVITCLKIYVSFGSFCGFRSFLHRPLWISSENMVLSQYIFPIYHIFSRLVEYKLLFCILFEVIEFASVYSWCLVTQTKRCFFQSSTELYHWQLVSCEGDCDSKTVSEFTKPTLESCPV